MTDKAPLTIQSAFDKAVTHLRKQGRPAVSEEGTCLYRSAMADENGNYARCAIGCLIPDEEYKPEFEDVLVGALPAIAALQTIFEEPFGFSFMRDLQNAHDHWYLLHRDEDFEGGALRPLYAIAQRYSLDDSALTAKL